MSARREGFRYEATITPAFDRRNPDPSKNYGIHGCDLRMVLVGPAGAVQFVAFTGWQLPHVARELWERESARGRYGVPSILGLTGADVGYHSPAPRYEGQTPMERACEYVAGGTCYYDGSGLRAEEYVKVLVREGSDGIWSRLEAEYDELFGAPQDGAA